VNNNFVSLARQIVKFKDDPLGFVMWAFPWDTNVGIQRAKLQSPWKERFNCEYGPDVWFCQLCDKITAWRKSGVSTPFRYAISSGHQIGKSAASAWINLWIMSTAPGSKITVTAVTMGQLYTKTWAELGRWLKMSLVSELFDYQGSRNNMLLRAKDAKRRDYWIASAQSSDEHNSEAFAGQHAAVAEGGVSAYILDEASGIAPKIFEVAEGGLSGKNSMIFAFGNPTQSSGPFYDCFHSKRYMWQTQIVSSREVQIGNTALHDEWKELYGEDSDMYKIRCLGQFPTTSLAQFIPSNYVDSAMSTPEYRQSPTEYTAIIGVDVARMGDDKTVICTRIGRNANMPFKIFSKIDTNEVIAKIIEEYNFISSLGYKVQINIDHGLTGAAIFDIMRARGYPVNEIIFAASADDSTHYRNKRAEIWGRMRDWLKDGAALWKDETLRADLISVEYLARDKIQLESKDAMKSRGVSSPDLADALAVTFGVKFQDVRADTYSNPIGGNIRRTHDGRYNPYEYNRISSGRVR